jgi:hypothetical protein
MHTFYNTVTTPVVYLSVLSEFSPSYAEAYRAHSLRHFEFLNTSHSPTFGRGSALRPLTHRARRCANLFVAVFRFCRIDSGPFWTPTTIYPHLNQQLSDI